MLSCLLSFPFVFMVERLPTVVLCFHGSLQDQTHSTLVSVPACWLLTNLAQIKSHLPCLRHISHITRQSKKGEELLHIAHHVAWHPRPQRSTCCKSLLTLAGFKEPKLGGQLTDLTEVAKITEQSRAQVLSRLLIQPTSGIQTSLCIRRRCCPHPAQDLLSSPHR